eukprot:Gb_10123 [translate_table: standard]
MLRSQWLRSQSIPRSEYNWSLKRIPCEKTGVDSIVVMCAKEEGSKCKRFHKMGRLIDASRVIEEPSNVIFLLVDTHEGVMKATFLRTRISLMGCLPKEFGAELANSEDFIATLSNFLGGVFMTQTNKSTQRESIPSSIQNSIQGEEQSEEENKEEEKETSEEKSEEPFIEQYDVSRKRRKVDSKQIKNKHTSNRKKEKANTQKGEKNNDDEDISGSSEDIDVPSVTLDDGIVQSEQNKIRERLYLNNLIDGGPLNLDVKQIYPPSHNPTHMQIRLPHKLHVQNIKTLLRNKPRAHVVNLLVLVDPEEVSSKNEFDRSRANFDYHYYVIGGCHSVEARRQLTQEFPQNVHFKEVKCIVYAGLTPLEAKLLAWDHNHDNEYRAEMTFIQKIRFFHNEFIDLCEGDKSKATFEFRLQCCMEVGIVIHEKDTKRKSDMLRAVDSQFQLAWHTGYVWDIIDNIFSMWDEFKVKGQKMKKMKKDLYSCSSSKSIPTLLPLPDDMSPSPWRCLQGIKDEKILISILSRVKSTDLSLNEMAEEFTKHKPNIRSKTGHRFSTCHDHIYVGYWTKDGEQCPQMINFKDGVDYNSILSYNAVVKKLKHMDKDSHGEIVNPYQKPQSLINYLIDMFSNEGDWVLDPFSGSGTTIACSLKKGRNCISVEKDLIQVNYINQRVNALSQLPDEFQEVCFKEGNIDSNKVVMCSMEPQPPLGNLIGKEHYGELANIEDPLSRSIVVIPDSIEEVVGSMHEIDPVSELLKKNSVF